MANKELIEKEHINWVALLLICLASTATGLFRDGFAALFPFIQREFDLTRAQLGLHTTFLFIPNMIGGLFTGFLIDSKSAKWGLLVSTMALGSIMVIHSIIPNYYLLLAFASVAGLIISLNMPAANKGVTEWFPQRLRTSAIGIMSTGVPFGGLLAAALLPTLAIAFGWRVAIIFPGLFTLICAVIFYFFYEDNIIDVSVSKNSQGKNHGSVWQKTYLLVKNHDLIILSIMGFFMGASSGTVITHFTVFLHLDHNLAENIAGIGFAAVQVGSLIGRPGWGIICDRYLQSDRRKGFLFIGITFSALALLLGFAFRSFTPPFYVIVILAFIAGFSGRGWHAIYFAAVNDTVDEEHIGIAIGFSLLFVRGGIMIFPPLFGYIADVRSSYDMSWIFIGLVIFAVSIIQYLYYLHREK